MTGTAQVEAAKVVANFLANDDDIPWPAQLRALETLSAMRQGFDPSRPRQADMANAAMHLLADGEAKLEVRAEAAKALGLMQINSVVPKYNYALVAHAAGQLAADLGAQIGSLVTTRASGKTKQLSNPAKVKYLTALLVGPVYQAFDGVPGMRESGLIHANSGPAAAHTEKVFELVKPVAKLSVELISSGARQLEAKQKELAAAVDALREFLANNAPPSRRLVQDGVEYPAAEAPAADLPAKPAPLAGPERARGKRAR
jgi:hypothetical protein